jgi:hypothetical protein
MALRMLVAFAGLTSLVGAWKDCPGGTVDATGFGHKVVLLNTGSVSGVGAVYARPNWGRSYFGPQCHRQSNAPWEDMFSLNLLDKSFSFTVDLSVVECNCNAALYLVAMPQRHENPSTDPDCRTDRYYCDANGALLRAI